MNVLIHIPARAGSKRLPGKNLKTVGGKSLVAHAAEVGRQFAEVVRAEGRHPLVVIDSDSAEIARVALESGADTWFQRAPELAGDDAPSADTVRACIDAMQRGVLFVVLLQPTSPLRRLSDVERCWKVAHWGQVATCALGDSAPNGAVYITRAEWLDPQMRNSFFVPHKTLLVPMAPEDSVDINTEDDLQLAERRWHQRQCVA